jgi:hypothetical protein
MELSKEMIEDIRRSARLVEYGKVIIEIDVRGPDSPVDIVSTISIRRRFPPAGPRVLLRTPKK